MGERFENGSIVDEERARLAETLELLRDALERAEGLHERIEGGYREAKRYLAEYRGEIDPSESFQNELALNEEDRRAAQSHYAAERLRKLLDSPYFARVDFAAGEGAAPVASYVGRFSFSFGGRAVVSDWRSPVAGLFYDFEPGPAHFDAPSGRVEGTLALKRQITVEVGRLVHAVDSGSSVRDDVLQYELSRTSDGEMRSIVASIQKEQNALIRDEAPGALVIQGVAGSGKTSIALHRVAYLLYRQRGRLTSKSVAILSPNRVFSDYVSRVLPELGEEPIVNLSLREAVEKELGGAVSVEAPRPAVDDADEGHRRRARRKGEVAFARELEAFLSRAADDLFQGTDIAFGRRVVEGAWLEERYRRYGGLPVSERIALVAGDVARDLDARAVGRDRLALPAKGEMRRKLAGMLRAKDELALYRLFLRERGEADLLKLSAGRKVEWEDACPLVLCRAAFRGVGAFAEVKHLVVDEMQDLTPVQHRAVARMFPCEKTVLGDFHQSVDDGNRAELADVAAVYGGARVAKLVRSYRSTCEIMALARRVKPVSGLEAVERHGEEPRIVGCANTAEVLARTEEALAAFEAGGRKTLGIVCKTDDLARRYHELLRDRWDVQLLAPESGGYLGGASIASVTMAKGLEFDEVVVLDADRRLYATDFDRNLLYVAVTRALHKLTVLHRGDPPAWLTA